MAVVVDAQEVCGNRNGVQISLLNPRQRVGGEVTLGLIVGHHISGVAPTENRVEIPAVEEAVEVLSSIATRSHFVVEVMGRMAGWLGYGVSIAGEAHMVIGVEDLVGDLIDHSAGPREGSIPVYLDLNALCARIQHLISIREAQGKLYGVVVLTEGLVELLPPHVLAGLPRDEHGMISLAKMNIGKLVAERTSKTLEELGCPKKVTGVQLGYEARCAMPHAFDVVLGCQLGRGTWRALVEENADACMVSMTGQMQHRLIPFSELVDSQTLQTTTRLIETRSDFHRLAHGLATQLNP